MIRPATQADLALLPALEDASDTTFATVGIVLGPDLIELPQLFPVLAVLVDGSPPAGFARLTEVDGRVHLDQLSVHPDHQRRGVGTALVTASCAWTREHGYPAITLCTFADVTFNGPFYARFGFQELTELTPGLGALRTREQRLGLDQLGRRTVMLRPTT